MTTLKQIEEDLWLFLYGIELEAMTLICVINDMFIWSQDYPNAYLFIQNLVGVVQ